MERAESKNLFKKDPVTNKRKPANQTISADNNSSSSVTTKDGGSSNSSTSGGPAKKRRQSREEEDVNEVANFLAGLKSTGSPEGSPSTPHKTVADIPSVPTVPVTHSVVGKSKEGGIPVDTSGVSNKNNMDEVNMTRALIASRLNMLPQQGQIALPYPSATEQNSRNQTIQRSNGGHSAAASLPRPPATASIGPNASRSFFGPSRPNGTFDRESLNHLSTDQLLALASHMKVREQMLRERAAASIAESAREQMLRERAAASIADSASAMGLMRPNHLHQQQLPLVMQCMPTREGGPFQRFPSSGSAASSSTGVAPQMAMNPGWRDGGLTYHEMLQLQESRLGRVGAGVVPFSRGGMVQQGMNQRMAFLSGGNRNKPPSYGDVPSPPQTTCIPNIDGISQNLGYPRAA